MKQYMYRLEVLMEKGGRRKDIAFLIAGGIALALSLMDSRLDFIPLPFDIAWVTIILCGVPILLEAIIGLVTRFDIKADVLVSMALIASVLIHQDFAAGEVAFIMQLGSLLEELTVAKARAGIERLVDLTPRTARLVAGGVEKTVPAEEVKAGDILRVLPGETVPVDGVIISGNSSIDQAVMTGESLPVEKGPGDQVSSGTVNQYGAFEMKAEKVGEDSSIQRMIRLVQSARADKAEIVGIADRWATWIVVIALSASVITFLFTGKIIRAVTILVVFCPCALVLATPAAIMAAIGNVTKHGFLVREGDALERLAAVDTIAFDKTGTLTYGHLIVREVRSLGKLKGKELFALVASAEKLSEHPVGKAVVRCFPGKAKDPDCFRMEPGAGVAAEVDGREVLAGNRRLMESRGIGVPDIEDVKKSIGSGSSVIYLAVDGTLEGYLVLSDEIRKETPEMIDEVIGLGIDPVLMTGDHEEPAAVIARKAGIEQVFANCRPETKLRHIGELESEGRDLCMIGDGINDAPALKKADVGIAMGGVGSDIAMDAADIVLVDDEIREIPHLLAISRRMMTTIKVNITFSMSLNIIAVILAILGLMGPVVGALVHNGGSFIVIAHSALLLRWKRKNRNRDT